MTYTGERKDRRPLIEFEIRQGLAFKLAHPEAAEDYRADGTLDDVAAKYDVAERYGPPSGNKVHAARCIVGFALRGNPFQDLGPVYEGAMTGEELDRIQKRRSQERAQDLLKTMSRDDIVKGGRNGAKARGYALWTPQELARLIEMEADARYYPKGDEFSNTLAARDLSKEFYPAEFEQGKQVRKATGISSMRQKLMKAQKNLPRTPISLA